MSEPREKTCSGCGAPLAADQRYCLHCGRRRGEPRVDFRRHLPRGTPQPQQPGDPPPSPPPAEAEKPQRDFTPLAAAGGIAVLGLMLLVGVLIGRGDGSQAVAPPPQVVRVQSGGEGATGSDGGAGALGAAAKDAKSKGSGKGKARGAGGKPPPAAITASEAELEALQEQSPQEYSESSAKLPDEIATPGKAPPPDDVAPGGGSKGAAIE